MAATELAALERLRDDHRQIGELIDTLLQHLHEQGHGARETRRLAELVGTWLRVHDEIEATLLRPALQEQFGADRVLRRSAAAAERVRAAFDRVEAMSPRDPAYAHEVQQLARIARQRFALDENELFDLARRAPLDWPALDLAMGTRQEALLSAGSGRP